MSIDPDRAGLQLGGDTATLLDVLSPDGRTETHLGVISTGNDVIFDEPLEERDDGTCGEIRRRTNML